MNISFNKMIQFPRAFYSFRNIVIALSPYILSMMKESLSKYGAALRNSRNSFQPKTTISQNCGV